MEVTEVLHKFESQVFPFQLTYMKWMSSGLIDHELSRASKTCRESKEDMGM